MTYLWYWKAELHQSCYQGIPGSILHSPGAEDLENLDIKNLGDGQKSSLKRKGGFESLKTEEHSL